VSEVKTAAQVVKLEPYNMNYDEVERTIKIIGDKLRQDEFIPHRIYYMVSTGKYPAVMLSDYIKEHTGVRTWTFPLRVSDNHKYWYPRNPFKIGRRYLIIDAIMSLSTYRFLIQKYTNESLMIRYAYLFVRDFDELTHYEKQDLYIGYKMPDRRWLNMPWDEPCQDKRRNPTG